MYPKYIKSNNMQGINKINLSININFDIHRMQSHKLIINLV